MKNYKVYMHIFPNNKKYIGITMQKLEQRWRRGNRYNKYMKNAIEKYGWENIKHKILFENLTKEEAEQKEIELIECYKSNQREFGYNIANGGNHQGTVSEETKSKISLANKGKTSWCKNKKFTNEERNKRYNSEFKEKISKKMKGRTAWNKGLKSSDEVKIKISNATKKAMENEEIRQKISDSKKGKCSPRKGIKLTKEQREKLSIAHKKAEYNVANAILG